MPEAGQFLIGLSNPFSLISSYEVFATLAMIFVVWHIYKSILQPVDPMLGLRSFTLAIFIATFVGLTITFVMQIVAAIYITALANPANSGNNRISPAIHKIVSESHGKGRFLIIFLAVALLLIGGGYAVADITDVFVLRLIGFTGGVGLLEELSKAIAGLLLYRRFFVRNKRGLFVPFALAGLGFGIGESFHYFSKYVESNQGFLIFMIRALWCMPLHSAWAIIILSFGEPLLLKQMDNKAFVDKTDILIALILASTPAILLHGLYDTFASYGDSWMWLVGILSFFVAFNYQKKVKTRDKIVEQKNGLLENIFNKIVSAKTVSDADHWAEDDEKPKQNNTFIYCLIVAIVLIIFLAFFVYNNYISP